MKLDFWNLVVKSVLLIFLLLNLIQLVTCDCDLGNGGKIKTNKTEASLNSTSNCSSVTALLSDSKNSSDISPVIQKVVQLYKTTIEPILFEKVEDVNGNNSLSKDPEGRTFILLPTIFIFRSLSLVGRIFFFSGLALTTAVASWLTISTVSFITTFIFKSVFWTFTSLFWFTVFSGVFVVGGLLVFQTLSGGMMGGRSLPMLT